MKITVRIEGLSRAPAEIAVNRLAARVRALQSAAAPSTPDPAQPTEPPAR